MLITTRAGLREAIDAYTEAARLRPDNAEIFYNLAIAYFESGNLTNGRR